MVITTETLIAHVNRKTIVMDSIHVTTGLARTLGSSHSVIYGTIHVPVSIETKLVPEEMSAPVKLQIAIRRKNYIATTDFALASRSITATKTTLTVRTIPAMHSWKNLLSVMSRDVNAQSSWTHVKEVTPVHVDI